jgi:serine/threonine-protein kinase HipA
MARATKQPALDVWMNGELTGRWKVSPGVGHEFAYSPSWQDSPLARPISLSMPLGPANVYYRGDRVEAFFDNLLPDSLDIRRKVQARVGARSTQAIDLLAEIGRDCAGALQFLPADSPPPAMRRIEGEPLTDSQVAQRLRGWISPAALGQAEERGFRLSLAGTQEKTAFLRHRGKWHLPSGAAPTTHIFKFPMGKAGSFQGDLSASVENEWLCSLIAREFGLETAACEMARFEDQRVLIVERFDRKLSQDGTWWMRLPQEDMCQALGSSVGIKYESDGGPGASEILALLLGAKEAFSDRYRFFKTQVLFWMLCAPDGHARNFSVFIEQGGKFSLTPLYDIISAYPLLGHGRNKLAKEKVKLAMAVQANHKHYEWDRIIRRHWEDAARHAGIRTPVERIISELSQGADGVATKVAARLPKGFPDSVAEPILSGMRKAAKRLAG